jgi:pyrroline-5-carboxylate reductase
MKVLIAGWGNMGKTYARSFLASRFIVANDLLIFTRDKSKASLLKEIPNENIHDVADTFISTADIIILAVKPQDFQKLSMQLKPFMNKEQLILSIMAGIRVETIAKLLDVKKIVRSMPNLPAQIGMGMTVFTASNDLDRKELFIIQNLINTTGKSVYVENEKLVDAATAVSGSGPAYVYYFMDAMIQSAIRMGFTLSQAELLVNQTFMGAVHLHNQSEFTCKEWIEKVASKGGTTEAAMGKLTVGRVTPNIDAALFAAFERAKELGS